MEQYFGPKLTSKQRLARLKAKFHQKKSPTEISIAHSSNQIDFASQHAKLNNNDDPKSTANPLQSQAAQTNVETTPTFANYNRFFDAEDYQGCSVKSDIDSNIIETTEIPSIDDIQKTILDLVVGLRDRIIGLTTDLQILRKQMARLEMKTMGCGQTSNNQMCIQPELLLDFDASIAEEGLPITTCVNLNEFEIKLRQDTKYREKLVGLFY